MKMIQLNLRFVATLFVVCCIFYTAFVWGVGQVFFSSKVQGSLITQNDKVIGSELVGQQFTSPRYFHGRPSAVDYNSAGSGGSNLAVSNPALYTRMADSVTSASDLDGQTTRTIAFDRVTASGSGLDPHITPENAQQQVTRISRERNLPESDVMSLLESHTEPAFARFMGPRKVNVLMLNIALDKKQAGRP